MANAAARELADTNIRFNELYVNVRVEEDSIAAAWAMKSSDFAAAYESLLAGQYVRGGRVIVDGSEDLTVLKVEKRPRREQAA